VARRPNAAPLTLYRHFPVGRSAMRICFRITQRTAGEPPSYGSGLTEVRFGAKSGLHSPQVAVATKNSVQLEMTLERANRVIIQMDAEIVRTAGVLASLAGEFTPPPRS
jgi:hypothetical protein